MLTGLHDREPFHDLGRPAPASIGLLPPEIEETVNRLLAICQHRLSKGGLLWLAGGWRSEAALYRVLTLTLARLRRREGITTLVAGELFIEAEAPARPDADVAVLLEATAYTDLSRWEGPRLSILTGLNSDLELEPEYFVALPRDRALFRAELRRLRDTWDRDPASRPGLTANAFGVDVPETLGGDLFVPVTTADGDTTPWRSVEGQWLAWEALKDRITPLALHETLRALNGYPTLIQRLDIRGRLRLFCS